MNQELRPLVIKRINKFKKFLLYIMVLSVLYHVNHHFSDIKKMSKSFLLINSDDYADYIYPTSGILSYF